METSVEEKQNPDLKQQEENEVEEEEFSFNCGGANASFTSAEDIFIDGQIKPIFPLFNRDLFFSGEDLDLDLPMQPPVKHVFVEAPPETAGSAACERSPEICKKSNSTGFSRIWRFKDLLGRSNSDGRDAFVFLNNAPPPPCAAEAAAEKKEVKEKISKGKKKSKTTSYSAHEVYLKSKAKGEERRRSYLPYRPELMGFFTNVNGGLTKNVHPY